VAASYAHDGHTTHRTTTNPKPDTEAKQTTRVTKMKSIKAATEPLPFSRPLSIITNATLIHEHADDLVSWTCGAPLDCSTEKASCELKIVDNRAEHVDR
jgi:hypothetical protein